jgi:hypothetical protein
VTLPVLLKKQKEVIFENKNEGKVKLCSYHKPFCSLKKNNENFARKFKAKKQKQILPSNIIVIFCIKAQINFFICTFSQKF